MTGKSTGQHHILIVDDSKTQREALRYVLEEAGYAVETAASGAEALSAAQESHADLVITDIVMPEMDGFALTRALRAKPEHAQLPVILLTSLSDTEEVLHGVAVGASGFLTKPFESDHLLAQVRDTLATAELRGQADRRPAATGRKHLDEVTVVHEGGAHTIPADTAQVLDMLLSSYDGAVRKATALSTALELVEASEARYRAIFDNAADAMFVAEIDAGGGPGRFVACNEAACDRLGYTTDELLALSPDRVSPDDPPGIYAELSRRLLQEGQARAEMVEVTKEGHNIPVEVNIHRVRWDHTWCGLIIARDISERRRADEALRESERRFRQVAESLPQLVWTCRANGLCDYLSPQWVQYTGIAEEPQLGYGWIEQLHPDDRQRAVAHWESMPNRGDSFAIEFRIRRHDGTYRWFHTLGTPLRDDAGNVVKWFGSNTDIQDIKAAQQEIRQLNETLEQRVEERTAALCESEERFASAFNFAAIGMALVSLDGHFLRVNQALCRILGYSESELLEKRTEEVGHEDDLRAGFDSVQSLKVGKLDSCQMETRYFHKSGRTIWVLLSISLVRDGMGRPFHFIHQIQDITKRKRADEALRQRDAILSAVAFAAERLLRAEDWKHEADGMLRRLGEAAGASRSYVFRLHEDPSGEMLASQLFEWCAPDVPPNIDSPDLQNVPLVTAGYLRWLERMSQGLPVLGSVRSFPESEQALLQAQGVQSLVAIPITERDRLWGFIGLDQVDREREWSEAEVDVLAAAASTLGAAVERREIEMKNREALATLDASQDAAYMFDPETLHFTYVNQGAVRLLGYSREELLALTPLDIQQDADEARYREFVGPLVEGERSTLRFTTIQRRKDGTEVPVEATLQYVPLPGADARFISICRDITERIARERRERHAQRLESLGTLASGVAHDLNNALSPITMGLQMLREDYPEDADTVDLFADSAKRASDMVRQLLTFAKGAEGARAAVDPSRLVNELKKMMQSTFPKNIDLMVRTEEGLPSVMGDATQLHQVLLNLCVNARDAMPDGGTLGLEVGRRNVDAAFANTVPGASPGAYVVLKVRDTGIGMAPEVLDRIFDPFFTTKSPEKGTGLGLSTTLGIVKGHGGFLHVYSQPGRGAAFAVYLPINAEEVETTPTLQPAAPHRGQGETILFVDDEASLRTAGRRILERLHYQPWVPNDAVEALTQIAEQDLRPHAVVTDLHMPGMNGLEFVRALRRTLPDVPIVISSGRLDEGEADDLRALGVTMRLDKPFTEAQLAETLHTLLLRETDANP